MNSIPIASLNQYEYCPKSAWILYVAGEFLENADTVAGALLHERSDSSARTVSGDLTQIRTVWLYSDTYGLIGLADLVEQHKQAIYPVEYKKGQIGDWLNHQVQLCAQAFCLEEMCGLKRSIRQGFLYYAATGRRKAVTLTGKLRRHTIKTIQAVRTMIETQQRPPSAYSRKCPRCSQYAICLPKEVELLNKRRWWR